MRLSTQANAEHGHSRDDFQEQAQWLRMQFLAENLAAFFKPRTGDASLSGKASRAGARSAPSCVQRINEASSSRGAVVGSRPRSRAPDERREGAHVFSSQYATAARVLIPTALG
jgi:hypothetical protein